jgi:hypothetical protein
MPALRSRSAGASGSVDAAKEVPVATAPIIEDEQKFLEATQTNRLTSVNEMFIRKVIGTICCIATVGAYSLVPYIREKYGPLSVALSAGVGVYRTGAQSL